MNSAKPIPDNYNDAIPEVFPAAQLLSPTSTSTAALPPPLLCVSEPTGHIDDSSRITASAEAATIETSGEESDAVFEDELELAAWTALPPSPTLKKKKQQKKKTQTESQESSPLEDNSNNTNMPPLAPIPLLICSIGNPGSAYSNTLHSAGHTAIASLATYIQASPFVKDTKWARGAVSHPSLSSAQPLWTLYQSPSYMNESGKPISQVYQTWMKTLGPERAEGRLVILHDELEKPLGAVSVREGQGLSARGHNGIKSILKSIGKTDFVRVGVGIGRPFSRAPSDVANYVLSKMNPGEKHRIEQAAEEMLVRLRTLSGG
ncbi:hypothetical protein AAFC00_007241 [Neodothiora populina]|uniref:peptidyl-tRNA hydrolase n=1 Tax=Neodothiora populina TaxID=2781224 RepID=A0ABR3PHW8_9PEZI